MVDTLVKSLGSLVREDEGLVARRVHGGRPGHRADVALGLVAEGAQGRVLGGGDGAGRPAGVRAARTKGAGRPGP